eukprot:CAMPEP_0170604904 /NCGR_PEP_ID=MMETSP0224-20130122/19688_1 /TAXON_ID=285029 /ORGANISM="Togula jolla, Strain CCCM 725" /LENGTH=46 /DNA_ID= /DNA_START= /DNA_END= /DNA_ORIENTATION=
MSGTLQAPTCHHKVSKSTTWPSLMPTASAARKGCTWSEACPEWRAP